MHLLHLQVSDRCSPSVRVSKRSARVGHRHASQSKLYVLLSSSVRRLPFAPFGRVEHPFNAIMAPTLNPKH